MIFNLTQPVLDSAPKFTYTGTYEYIDDGGGNWRIKFLTSGVFTPLKKLKIDAFLVGGGAAGCYDSKGAQGGAGGYTRTVKNIELSANTEYQVVVGSGGTFVYRPTTQGESIGNGGGASSAFGFSADGAGANTYVLHGVTVGSGGCGGAYINTTGTKVPGGSDGSNGGNGSTGQGTTTREFGEPGGDLYSGGGAAYYNKTYNASAGEGGGGKYANGPQPGETNKGGGGCGTGTAAAGGSASGGSGIVIIRKHKEAAA